VESLDESPARRNLTPSGQWPTGRRSRWVY